VAKKIEEVVDIFAEAKEKRRLAHEAKQKKEVINNDREEFRKFFAKIKAKLNLAKELEEIIWKHFQDSGFDSKDKFEAGIKHFGYKI
jgi:hypothetical protein